MDNIEGLLKITKNSEAKFISLKYLDKEGNLRQVDVTVKSLMILEDFILVGNIKLRPIENKCFIDPFRSYPTIFCLCDNLSEQYTGRSEEFAGKEYNSRLFLKEVILANNNFNNIKFELGVNFFIRNKSNNLENEKSSLVSSDNFQNYQNQVEPYDQLANLRAEIVDILEKIGIPTTFHCHASKLSSCSIVIKTHHLLDIADYYIVTYFIIRNVAECYGKAAYFLNDCKNDLYLLFPMGEYDKTLATSIIFSIICNLENNINNIYLGDQLMKSSIMENISQYAYKLNLKLSHSINPYLAIAYLIVYGFDNTLKDKLPKEMLNMYFSAAYR